MGEIIDDRDRSRVKADLTKWGEGKIFGNTTLSQYKEDYIRLMQRAETYGIITDDITTSNFTKKELMDLFLEPLKAHHRVKAHHLKSKTGSARSYAKMLSHIL